jgi:hypothetical protein
LGLSDFVSGLMSAAQRISSRVVVGKLGAVPRKENDDTRALRRAFGQPFEFPLDVGPQGPIGLVPGVFRQHRDVPLGEAEILREQFAHHHYVVHRPAQFGRRPEIVVLAARDEQRVSRIPGIGLPRSDGRRRIFETVGVVVAVGLRQGRRIRQRHFFIIDDAIAAFVATGGGDGQHQKRCKRCRTMHDITPEYSTNSR